MAASTKKPFQSEGSAGLVSLPCGHGKRSDDVSVFGVRYHAPSPAIECGSCHKADRPLWWGICAWCGAEEEEFEAAA